MSGEDVRSVNDSAMRSEAAQAGVVMLLIGESFALDFWRSIRAVPSQAATHRRRTWIIFRGSMRAVVDWTLLTFEAIVIAITVLELGGIR